MIWCLRTFGLLGIVAPEDNHLLYYIPFHLNHLIDNLFSLVLSNRMITHWYQRHIDMIIRTGVFLGILCEPVFILIPCSSSELHLIAISTERDFFTVRKIESALVLNGTLFFWQFNRLISLPFFRFLCPTQLLFALHLSVPTSSQEKLLYKWQ